VMPGEPRRVLIHYPAKLGARATVNLRGWTVRPASAKARDAGAVDTNYLQPYYEPPVYTPPVKVDSVTFKLPSK
jgi:hypothetical protein